MVFRHVLQGWDESTLSSLAPPRIRGRVSALAEMDWRPCHGDDCGEAVADVTPLVRDWLDGEAANNGLARHASRSLDDRPAMGTMFAVASRESDHPPVLRITMAGVKEPTVSPTDPAPTPRQSVVTETVRITNYGYQDRGRVVYY